MHSDTDKPFPVDGSAELTSPVAREAGRICTQVSGFRLNPRIPDAPRGLAGRDEIGTDKRLATDGPLILRRKRGQARSTQHEGSAEHAHSRNSDFAFPE